MAKSKSVVNHSYGFNTGYGDPNSNLITPTKFGKQAMPETYTDANHLHTGTFGNQNPQASSSLLKPPALQTGRPY